MHILKLGFQFIYISHIKNIIKYLNYIIKLLNSFKFIFLDILNREWEEG